MNLSVGWWVLIGGTVLIMGWGSVVQVLKEHREASIEEIEDEAIHHALLARTYELRNDMQQAAYHRLQAAELAESAKRYRRRGTK